MFDTNVVSVKLMHRDHSGSLHKPSVFATTVQTAADQPLEASARLNSHSREMRGKANHNKNTSQF